MLISFSFCNSTQTYNDFGLRLDNKLNKYFKVSPVNI